MPNTLAAVERLRFGSLGDLHRLLEAGTLSAAITAAGSKHELTSELRTSLLTELPLLGAAAANERLAVESFDTTHSDALAERLAAGGYVPGKIVSEYPLPTGRKDVPARNATEGPTVIFTYAA